MAALAAPSPVSIFSTNSCNRCCRFVSSAVNSIPMPTPGSLARTIPVVRTFSEVHRENNDHFRADRQRQQGLNITSTATNVSGIGLHVGTAGIRKTDFDGEQHFVAKKFPFVLSTVRSHRPFCGRVKSPKGSADVRESALPLRSSAPFQRPPPRSRGPAFFSPY